MQKLNSLLEKANIVKLSDEELITIDGWYNIEDSFDELARNLYKLLKMKALIIKGEHGATLTHNNELFNHKGAIP
jgi:sugar/nucleoside kinase (ribokinase family)